ncbi:hypothetical protein GE061_006667 [Apolygus lucorum]|uniref:Integrase catalytic domain-containing protein n=1 Tax=Apolygus lucorum TaxID=248454 RepID=A0A8S9WVX1_APOLU|nr:hypothetical protein GE061_006667 [Apolygus lucorum]
MYRQFLVNRENTDLQRILWRNSASDKLKVYRLLTVTYGTAPAPYLSTKTLQRLARDYADQFPEASQSLENDFYVDDYISGHDSLELAVQLQKDMTELLKLGGMNLRKWTANHPDLLAHFPPESVETATAFTKFDDGSPDPTVKVLGLQWNPRLDTFVYNVPNLEIPKEFTKRQAYSLIGKLFDPLGFVAPAVVAAKFQMQNVWKTKCDWGVDYCGPILVRHSQRKGVKPNKAYIAIFVCFTTEAIRVELVTDLSTQSFLSAFQRFIARRGKPAKMLSDNAKTFVGAKGELEHLETAIKAIQTYSGELSIKWEFIPPGSPHFGGLWEIMVRQLKNHLKKVLGKASLSYMEMNTVLTRIEAVINSRPITSVTDDPSDLSPLTPAHFLVGTTLTSLPPVIAERKLTLRARWIGHQALLEHFWARWSREYLTSLQTRSKWRFKTENLKSGDMVMVHDVNSPPFYWRLGRISKIIPGEDGLVRVFEVKTHAGTVRRTLSQISPLEESGGQDV